MPVSPEPGVDGEGIDEAALDALASEFADPGRPVGDSALAQMLLLFEGWGLAFPPVPGDLAPALRVHGPGLLGTRDGVPSPYDLDWFLADLAEDPGDYLVVGHAGHGVNSWAMHYHLVHGPLALLLQIPWGGAYTHGEASATAVDAAFADARELLGAAGDADALGLAPGQRLVVVESGAVPSRWGVAPRRAPDLASRLAGLERSTQPLKAAVEWSETRIAAHPDPRPFQPVWG